MNFLNEIKVMGFFNWVNIDFDFVFIEVECKGYIKICVIIKGIL